MTKINRLKLEAKEACELLGHKMSAFETVKTMDGRTRYNSECSICFAYVQVTPNPAANDIDIGGNAVANLCLILDSSPL